MTNGIGTPCLFNVTQARFQNVSKGGRGKSEASEKFASKNCPNSAKFCPPPLLLIIFYPSLVEFYLCIRSFLRITVVSEIKKIHSNTCLSAYLLSSFLSVLQSFSAFLCQILVFEKKHLTLVSRTIFSKKNCFNRKNSNQS